MTQTAAASQASDLLVVVQALFQIFLNFGLPILILVAVVTGYQWLVKRLDREVEVRALRAVARRRVQRREAARARNRSEIVRNAQGEPVKMIVRGR